MDNPSLEWSSMGRSGGSQFSRVVCSLAQRPVVSHSPIRDVAVAIRVTAVLRLLRNVDANTPSVGTGLSVLRKANSCESIKKELFSSAKFKEWRKHSGTTRQSV